MCDSLNGRIYVCVHILIFVHLFQFHSIESILYSPLIIPHFFFHLLSIFHLSRYSIICKSVLVNILYLKCITDEYRYIAIQHLLYPKKNKNKNRIRTTTDQIMYYPTQNSIKCEKKKIIVLFIFSFSIKVNYSNFRLNAFWLSRGQCSSQCLNEMENVTYFKLNRTDMYSYICSIYIFVRFVSRQFQRKYRWEMETRVRKRDNTSAMLWNVYTVVDIHL